MKARYLAVLVLATVLTVTTGPLVAADVEVRPSKLVAGQAVAVELAVDPNRLLPKPRSELLFAWWCWDIDPRPPECEQHYCESPVPNDPICGVSKKARAGKLVFEFNSQGLLDHAHGQCGPTGFVLRAKLEGGGISEAKGSVEIDCGKRGATGQGGNATSAQGRDLCLVGEGR